MVNAKRTKVKGQVVGYIRVSTMDQNTERQLEGLELDKVFTDKASGKDTKRPALQAALSHLREGDRLVCHSLCRLGRNLMDLQKIISELTGRGVEVQFMKENLVFTGDDTPMSKLLLGVMGAVAQFEREVSRDRQREGIALAKKAGVYKGRKPALTLERMKELQTRVAGGGKKAALAREFGVSRETVYQYLRRGTTAVSVGK